MQLVLSAPAAPARATVGRRAEDALPRDEHRDLPRDAAGDAWQSRARRTRSCFPNPLESSCVALVLSDAYSRGLPHPRVGRRRARRVQRVRRARRHARRRREAALGPREARSAAQVLERAGAAALAAVERAYYGARRARAGARRRRRREPRAAATEAAPLLARGLCEAAGGPAQGAREARAMQGGGGSARAADGAGRAVARVHRADARRARRGRRARAASPTRWPPRAVGDAATRVVLRAAFAQALEAAPGPRGSRRSSADTQRGPAARLEMMRAAGARVNGARGPRASAR